MGCTLRRKQPLAGTQRIYREFLTHDGSTTSLLSIKEVHMFRSQNRPGSPTV